MKTHLNTHKARVRLAGFIVALLASLGLLAACTSPSTGAASAVDAGNSISNTTYAEFNKAVPYPYASQAPTDPLERQNLAKRLVQYNSANDTNYVYVQDFAGHVIGYYVIVGKVSSTGSEMTATQTDASCGRNSLSGCVLDAVGDDGSYGPEEGGSFGVFFFTASGALVETDNPFIESSTPIKIYASVPQLDAAA